MIRDTPADAMGRGRESEVDLVRALEDQRRVQRALEGTALAHVADKLTDAAERLLEVQRAQQAMRPEHWMSHEECAAYLKRSPDALYRLAASGEIPRHKLGRDYLYNRREVDAAVMGR